MRPVSAMLLLVVSSGAAASLPECLPNCSGAILCRADLGGADLSGGT